jgi:DNA replication protein DnaC
MAYDGKIMARARDIITELRRGNEAEVLRRRTEIFARIPSIMEAEAEITRLMTSVASEALKSGADAGRAVESAKSKCEILLKKRSELLRSAGYPENYIDEIYSCHKCRDTGYILGKPCDCLKELYKAEAVRELSSMLNISGQCFENFDLNYYSDTYDPTYLDTPRKVMSTTFGICREYAKDFGNNSVNLLFRGNTGLGKTFLSASIARVVSEKGFSVVYDTIVSVIEVFEMQKFDRSGDNAEDVSSRIRRYLDCDLLILDDLGTEMSTAFTVSAIYSLINSRLISGGKTIISTNLSEDELKRRYTPQIASRLEGEYVLLKFAGRDIRAMKRERGLK